ncbi:uncharacterized protein LOC128985488 [Macrosteles quadrilineatus]|uniref:uncharacterized protein LOC128985488 n=1 Tax=Macrosteles quadrilineatus TaxID=74068 RepID=UPI0023E226F3|nr:uncharacterized protein LOC128985488 [Macrosteles quadrilineatus]
MHDSNRTEDNQPILNYNEDILEHDFESDPEPDCSKDDPPSLLQPLIVEPYSSEELKKLRENVMSGRRMVDVGHIFRQLQVIASHPMKCTMGKYELKKEIRSGLFCTWSFYCDNCEKTYVVTSLPVDEKHNDNDALVWGAMSIGIGFAQLEELFSLLDVPVMSQEKYIHHEKKVGDAWETILVHKMQRNAEEEKKIALEKGNIFQGKPYITVIGDGGWAKRSYGHGMSSKSGVVVVSMTASMDLWL